MLLRQWALRASLLKTRYAKRFWHLLVRAKRERVNLVVEQMDCLDVWIGDVAHQTIIQLTLALGVIGLIVRCHKMKHVQDGRVINCT